MFVSFAGKRLRDNIYVTSAQIQQSVEELQELKFKLVGNFYPTIIQNEIDFLLKELIKRRNETKKLC